MRKIMAIILMMLFLIPVGAMAGMTKTVTQQPTAIKVGDAIDSEKVVWVASDVDSLSDSDIAYVTVIDTETKNTVTPILTQYIYHRSKTFIARNKLLIKQFYVTLSARWTWWTQSDGWHVSVTDEGSTYGVYSSLWVKDHISKYTYSEKFYHVDGYFHKKYQPTVMGDILVACVVEKYGLTSWFNYIHLP